MKKRVPIYYLKGAMIAVLLFGGSFTILQIVAASHPLGANDILAQSLIYAISVFLGVLAGVGSIATHNKKTV